MLRGSELDLGEGEAEAKYQRRERERGGATEETRVSGERERRRQEIGRAHV